MRITTAIFILIALLYNYRRGRLVGSASVWATCYLMIFVLFPTNGIEGYTINNTSLIDLYAVIGAFMFLLGILWGENVKIKPHKILNKVYHKPIFRRAFVFFIISTVLAVVVFIAQHGIGAVIGILLGSVTSKGIALGGEQAGKEEIFIQLMLPCMLAIWVSAESHKEKFLRVICLAIFCVTHILFSFTRIFLITVLAIVLIYELRNKRRKVQMLMLSFGVLALLLLMVSMNFIRCFGLGEDISFETFLDIGYVFESTDFGMSYIWFDQLLDYGYPNISIFTWLTPLYAFIPRSIWPSKPEPLSLQILKKIDPGLAADGYSTAGNSVLGEGYAIIGVIGIFLFPLIWGIICTYFDKRYYYRINKGIDDNIENIIYYIFAIFIMMSAQRGDWSQYMTIFIYFWIIPLLFLSKKYRRTNVITQQL